MNTVVTYSRPRGRYGRYIFTIMVYFSEPTETVEIAVVRPQTQTGTRTVYSCGHCGRWHTITTHFTTTTYQKLSQREYRKDGQLALYRYDNVEPDDWIELTLRDSDLLKYQWTKISIYWDSVFVQNYWRDPRRDDDWYRKVSLHRNVWDNQQAKYDYKKPFPTPTQQERQDYFKEEKMTDKMFYEVTLLAWDEYMQSKTGEMRVEEDLIQKTMNAETITIKELLLEPDHRTPSIAGEQRFIEGELRYLP